MTTVVEVRDLRKRYGEIEAVRGVSFTIREGETFGFLGPNGAGKTTTISILCTLIKPTDGSAEVGGFDVVAHPSEVRRRIGLVFQDPTLDDYLSAEENLRFHAELYGMPRAQTGPRIRQVLEMVELWAAGAASSGRSRAACDGGSRSRGASCIPRACSSWTSRPWVSIRRRARTSGATSRS
jgi:ABC-2 type transport system ATP-binding protein